MSGRFRIFMYLTLTSCSLPVKAAERSISAAPGTLVRWAGPGATRCAMKGRVWPAIRGACYYPIDLLQKPVPISVLRLGPRIRQNAIIHVEPVDHAVEEIELPDIPQAHPSPEDLRRAAREQLIEARVWSHREGPRKFTLPLGPPARPLPKGKAFGVQRVYNGKPDPQLHMGIDYPVPLGSPVLAVASGTVVLARDLFYAGNAVFVDHGDGLVSMYFHLAEIRVRQGEQVRKGQELGAVGSTGRATGPHLFFAVRWHGARIDPSFLLGNIEEIPAIPPAAPRG